jgi:hypothetical protein
MKKYIFPVLLILVLLASFIIIQDVKIKHSSQVQSYDNQISDLKKRNAHYENQNKSLQLLTDSLNTKYLESKLMLENQIHQNRTFGNQIKNLVYSSQILDTSKTRTNLYQNSDSLINLALGLAQSSFLSDSLCQLEIERLERISQIQLKRITICDSNYRVVQLSLQTSIEKNKDSELENKDLKRQIKRNKLIAKIEGSVLLLTATIISTLLLIH